MKSDVDHPSPEGNEVHPIQPPDAPLKHPALVRYILARVLFGGSNQIKDVAIGWQVYALTGSALDLGLVGLIQFLPRLLLTAVAGDMADRHDRRHLAAGAQALQCLGLLWLALGSAFDFLDRGLIFGIVFLLGISQTFQGPASTALLPSLVPTALLPRALATNGAAVQTATILGPALGGFLYLLGPAWVYGLTALLIGVSTLCFLGLPPPPRPEPGPESGFERFVAGLRFLRARPVIVGTISLDMFAVLFGGATALLPMVAHEVLHTGPWGLGLLRSAPAVGAVVMSVWLASRPPFEQGVGRVLYAAVASFGLSIIAFGFSTSLPLSIACLALSGASDMLALVIRQSLVQLQTPDDMRGRVSAVSTIFIGASNQLGEFESGLAAAWLGLMPAITLGGLATVGIVLLWTRLFPALFRVERLDAA